MTYKLVQSYSGKFAQIFKGFDKELGTIIVKALFPEGLDFLQCCSLLVCLLKAGSNTDAISWLS